MFNILIVIIVILLAGTAIVLMIRYTANQNRRCPYCQLEFVTDLFMIKKNALPVCPFCHQWILVTKSFNKYIVKKL